MDIRLTINRKAALTGVGHLWTGWWNVVRESFPGAWQRNVEVTLENALSFFAVYACVSLISSDIGKMRLRLMAQDDDGIWAETEASAFSPVIRRPNHFQNRIKFVEWWITSKLLHGNTYVLKLRDERGVVKALYVLDPSRVSVLIGEDGSVFYQLKNDNLARMFQVPEIRLLSGSVIEGAIIVPAREIIHDIMVALFHPLVGVSPIFACGLAAMQGLKIQKNSYRFFENFSQPGGVLSAPGAISKEAAARVKEYWDTNFGGNNVGKVAVLGDGLEYKAISINPNDAQLIQQLKWTAETVCACFHVPPYKIGVGPMPSYNNVQALNLEYYNQALQNPIESFELALDEGLELPKPYGTEFDLDDLLRMDTPTKTRTAGEAIKAGFMAPNEARKKFDLKPVLGGHTPYMQQQNFSLAALDRRDKAESAAGLPPGARRLPAPAPNQADQEAAAAARAIEALTRKAIAAGLYVG